MYLFVVDCCGCVGWEFGWVCCWGVGYVVVGVGVWCVVVGGVGFCC